MDICILAAGAGGMYCGSCMRDNALASALKRLGHDVTLIPLYTPLRTENHSDAISEIFYGGVNVYLQHWSGLFRHTPRMLDWLFDRPWLLGVAGRFGINTPPEKLAGLTTDIIKGEEGAAEKELRRLIAHLKQETPDVICLPNLMFVGMARLFRQELNVPVVCELTGEDIFLDAMHAPDREQLKSLIRARAGDVSRFVASSEYYAGSMSDYLGIARDQIDVVYTGISGEYLKPTAAPQSRAPNGRISRPHLPGERVSPRHRCDAKTDSAAGHGGAKLKVAGYLGGRDEKWARGLLDGLAGTPMADAVSFLGEVSREEKLAMIDSVDVLTVPTVYPESKGVYILEAFARGVPVVQPDHGSFPELIRLSGAGLLVPPGNSDALAASLADLLRDPARRSEMGRRGAKPSNQPSPIRTWRRRCWACSNHSTRQRGRHDNAESRNTVGPNARQNRRQSFFPLSQYSGRGERNWRLPASGLG